jgi:HD-GYP domain-containing protein (c-di-GMP phosphodiesterase class II)
LDKPGELNDEEFRMIKSHSTLVARILEPIKAYAEIIPMVLQHHERFDGKGYPDGLSGEEIELGARILAVADVFDALKSDRPYRDGWSLERVNELILKEGGRQFDPLVVDAFLTVAASKDIKAA